MDYTQDSDSNVMDPKTRVTLLMCLHAQQRKALSALKANIRSARRESDLIEERLLPSSVLVAAATAATIVAVPRCVQASTHNRCKALLARALIS